MNWLAGIVRFRRMDERGQGMVEYGIIIALMAAALIGTLTALTGSYNDAFSKLTATLNNAAH